MSRCLGLGPHVYCPLNAMNPVRPLLPAKKELLRLPQYLPARSSSCAGRE